MSNNIKTDQEIQIMRKAGSILADTLSMLSQHVKPGVSTAHLDKLAEEYILSQSASPAFKGYRGYPATICASVDNEVVHTIPSNRNLKEGQILTIDCGVNWQGYNSDSAMTFFIGEVEPEVKNFVLTTRKIMQEAIKLVKPGIKVGDIGSFINTEVKKAGFHIIKELIGHGIGKDLHEPPEVPNFGKQGSGATLKPGMTFCIEPIVGFSTRIIEEMPDHWTIVTQDDGLACQEEHTVLVTDSGVEVLTLRKEESWI